MSLDASRRAWGARIRPTEKLIWGSIHLSRVGRKQRQWEVFEPAFTTP